MPCIRELMSPAPHTIGAQQSIEEALKRMRASHVHHLPVLDGAHVVGMLSDGDIRLVEALGRTAHVTVADAMTADPYVVACDDDLHGVVTNMAKRKIGSAIVLEGEKVVGIFTTTDALNLLAQHLAAEAARAF